MSSPIQRIVRCAALLSIASFTGAPGAQAEPALPTRSPSPTLELANLMAPAEFRAAGLHRLSDTERATLDDWVGRLVVRIITARKRAVCAQAIETRVSGEFAGWAGGTVVQLENDQVWRQRDGLSKYAYRYSPRVVIKNSESGCVMRVDGVEGEVPVERIW